MARVSKSNVFALDTSSILNQLIEIEQRAKAADAALINMGSGKKSKPNVAAYAEFADVLKTVTETINLLQGAMDGNLKTKSLKDATTLLDNMGVSAHEFVQTMSELTKFKITDVVDEKEAIASMRSIGDRLTKLFGNKEFFKGKDFGFKLDMEVFDKKDIMAQYQALMKAVAPTIQHMSRMIADAGWEQLALDNKFAVTKDVIKEGMEDIVAEVDKKIADLEKRKANLRNSLENFVPKMPQKSGKKITIDDLDSLANQYINAQAALPDKLDKSSGKGNAKISAYLGAGHRLQDAVTAAQQDSDSEVAQYIERNKDWFEAPLQVFEEWKAQNKKYIAQLRKAYSDRFAEIDNELLEEKEKKKQYYVKATVPNEPENVGTITKSTKDTLVKEQRALSTDLSVMFQKLIPTIEEGGAEAGAAIQKAMVGIFDRLKKAGIDASLESQIPIEEGSPLLNDDAKEALGLRNDRAQNYNAIAQSIAEDYNRIQNMTAEEIAADMGQTVIDIANTILATLQQNNLSMGVDNGIYKAVEDTINSTQAEIAKLEESVDPIKKKIAVQEKAIQTVNKALTPLSSSATPKAAEDFLRYSVGLYDAYVANPNDERFAASTGKYGANVKEQLMVRIKQALDDALKQGVSQESLKDLNLDQFDFEAAQQVLIEERAAAEQQIQLLKEENENNLKMLKEKETALTLAKQRKDMVVRERAASVEEQAASSSNEENNVPKRPRGRPRKNPLPAESAGGVAASEAVIREEGDKIVSAINQNTDKVISLLGGKSLLQQLEMASPATKDFSTANKDAAEAQLKQIYSELKAYRMSRSRGKFDPLYRESKTVAYQKAYDEAKAKGVAQDVLNAYKLNVTKKDYTSSLATLQNAQDTSILQTLNTLGTAVKQLADGMQNDNSDDISRLLEAINSITEQMRVCCDNMSAMQDIKPALEPISQISNTLSEILVKVSALGGGEGTSAVDAQKEALKQNLKSYFDSVTEITNKRDINGRLTQRETGANLYSNGKLSMFWGGRASVSGKDIAADLIKNLQDTPILNLHSHTFSSIYDKDGRDTGAKWANGTFSHGDINFDTKTKKLGIPLSGEFVGNLLRIFDISKLTETEIRQVASELDKQQSELAKNYPKLFQKNRWDFKLVGETADDFVETNRLADAALENSVRSIGKDPNEILKTFDVSTDKGLDLLADFLIEIKQTVHDAVDPMDKLDNIMSIGGNQYLDQTTRARIIEGSMQPIDAFYTHDEKIPGNIIFDAANENQELNTIISINSTLQSIYNSLSAIQSVVASPQAVDQRFIADLKSGALDISKYANSNYNSTDKSDEHLEQLHKLRDNAQYAAEEHFEYMLKTVKGDENGMLTPPSAQMVSEYLQLVKQYLAATDDVMKAIVGGRPDYSGHGIYDDLRAERDNIIQKVSSEPIIQGYIDYLDYNSTRATPTVESGPISNHYDAIIKLLNNIYTAITKLSPKTDSKVITSKNNIIEQSDNSSKPLSTSARTGINKTSKSDSSQDAGILTDWGSQYSTSIARPNSGGGGGNNPPPVTNDIYQLLSSKPYATEATLSKVLTELEISQISNTLSEILAKVSVLGSGEGASAVDVQKEVLKQNLKEYFNRVSEHNNKTEASGDKTTQETGASIYKSGKVSYFSAESREVPAELAIADFIRNLQDTPVVSLHSHPWAEDYGELWANNTFSPEDISYSTISHKLGIGLEGEISGNLLRILDISKLTVEEIKQIAQAYQTQMAPLSKLYPDLFLSSPSGNITARIDDTLDGHILANQLIDNVLRESIQSVNKNPDDIFRIFDITDDKSIDALANLILEVGESAQSAMSPIERLQHILDAFGKPALDSTQLARLADGSMQPMEVLYDKYDQVPGGAIIDTANENQEINLLTSINTTLSSIQQVLSTIQTVVASPQNITRQFFDDLNGDLDIFKYTKSNYDGQDHSNYKAARIHDEYENARHQRMEAYRYANDNRKLDKNKIIDRDTVRNVELYIQAFQKYIGSIYDRIKFIQTGSDKISPSDKNRVASLTSQADNEIMRFVSEPIIKDYLHYLNQNQPSADVQSSSQSYRDILNSIVGKLESIIEVLHNNIALKNNSVNKDQTRLNNTSIDGGIDDWKRPYTTEDNSRKSMPTAARNNNDGNNHHPVSNDIYQLLSSKPYATEATLSKVLTKLESGIATNNKAGTTKATEQAQQNSQKGVSLSAVRGTFNRASTIDTRMQRLLAGDSSLKNTDEYAAYEKAKSELQSKKGKYLDPTDSPKAAASRLNYATQYLATMEQTADALQKVAKRQQVLNNLANDPRSTIIPETTVVNAQNMEQELMKAAKITDAVGAKFTLGEKFGEATYEIKDATNHLNKMAIAYDKVNKRFIITQKSSKAIDPNAPNGSSDRDDYGIKSAYMSRFKANAKLNASLNGVPEIKNTQAYKDYMDAYNQMLARKNDFFNYSNKTEAEKQELLNIALAAEETHKELEKLVKTQREFNDIKARGTTMQGTAGLSGAALNTELQRLAQITNAQQANFKMAKDNGQTIKTATYEVKDHTNQVHEMQMAYNSLTGEVVITETRVTQSLSRMQTVMGSLQKKLKQVLTYIASYGSIYQIFNIIRQGVTYVKEIDSALTELKKVTNATDAEYEKFLNHMSETSAVVGSTVKDLTMMSADWARLGYSMEEAGELARSTAVLLNVSEFTDANSATEALISTIQAFGYAADDSMTVVDKLNEVGNNFAVSSDGLATALQTSASSLMAGGNDLNQAVAMIAAGNKVVQDPSVMGAALRTISLRIRGTKTELEELGEDTEGMVTTTSKLQDKIKGLTGVDILDDTGAYKDTYTILVEIGKVWDDLTDQKKAAALELLAGKNRSNALAAILTNVEDLEAAYESALQAEGSANKELETYLNSIQGKLDKFHNAVQTMWNDLISSDFIKFIVSAGTALVNFIDKIGILGTALTALAGVQVVKNFSSITSVLKTLYSQSFATGQSMLALGLAQLKTSLHTRLLNSAFVQTAVTMKIFSQEELATMTVTQLLQAGFKGLWARLQEIGAGLKTFMALNPWMWAVLGAAAAAAALIYFSNSTKRAKESLQDAQDTLSETSSELRELRGELEDTQDRIKELQSMGKLSFTDQEELKNLKRQNNELQRRIALLQLQEEQEKKIAANKFVDYMDKAASEKTQYDHSGEKPSFFKKWLDSMGGGMDAYATEDKNIDTQFEKYQEYQQAIADLERQIISDKKQGLDTSKDEEQLENLRTKVIEVSEYMTGKFTEWGESSKGIDYGISDEADKWLDYINNIQDKWAILSGGQSAVSNALTRIFDKDAFAGVSDQIREFADALPDTADEGQELEEYISDLLDKFPKLRETLEYLNIPLKDVADYFLYAGDAASESSSEIDNFDKIVQGLNGLKDAYGTLKTAITEYNSQGFMSLDALTALLDLSPEYLALLQMENGQLALNKEAMMEMVQAKLAEAEATVVQNAITQIASLSNKAEAQSTTWVKESAMDAIPALGEYSKVISVVGQNAIVSAGQVDAFMAAIRGAEKAGVDTSAINDVISGMDAQITALHSLGDNLSGSFNTIMSSGSSGGGGNSDTLLDWLEHYYDTLENEIAELNAQLESKIDDTTVIKSKNTIIDKIIDLYDEKMQKLTNAEATYTARAEKLFKSFSKDIQDKIKNGSLDIQKISDSDLSSDISNYYKYIKAASEARVEMEELQQSIADASKKKFDNITTGYENELGLSQSKIDSFEKQIDLLEERGEQVGTALYSAMMDEQKTRLKSLNKERNELQKVLDNEVKLGHVKVNSDTWYEMVGVINDLDEEIVDTQISIEGYQNSINELKWDAFDELIEKLDRINSQLEFLFERFTDNDEAFDDDGSWTNKGIAALGMLAQQMQLAKNNADKYRKALQQLEQDYKKHLFSEEKYLEKKAIYEEALRDEIESYEDIKDAIVDLNKERIDAVENALSDELDMYKKLVDKKKELLDAEKDLYNFQKGINAKQKNITLLEKQIAALTGSSSAEDITRRIKLQAELNTARQELDDEYYEHSMELTSESLDNEVKYREDQLDRMARDYDEWLKDREQVISTSLNLVQDNATIVLEQIDLVAEEYGITIAEEIRKPWEAGANAIETYRNKFTDEEMTGAIDEFKKMLDGVSSKWEETSSAAEEASKAAIAAIKKQKDETIKAQNEMLKNYEATIGSMSNVSTVTGGDSVPAYTGGTKTTEAPPTKPKDPSGLQRIGASEIGKVQYKTIENGVGAQIATINGVNYLHHQYKDSKGNVISRYYRLSDLTRETDRNHKVYYSSLGKKINVYRKYAKGTLGTSQSAMALIDELGEELVLNAGPNGRLQYLTKGTSVIPADITKKLMDLALDPTEVLERSRPHANANMSVASNIELNLNIAEVVHVDHADADMIPDLANVVKTQMDKYMKGVNNNLKKYVR